MTALFTLPGQTPLNAGSIVPGGKLYFYQTGTSTPQNTYTTEALTVANTNPVIADANGLFGAIYLDPSLPSYRATLKTSADVTLVQWDGVPSNQNQATLLRVVSTDPSVVLYDTDGTANQRKYRLRAIGNAVTLGMLNDAENSETVLFSATAGVSTIPATALVGVDALAGSSYTGTLTGYASPPTGTIYYCKIGAHVTLFVPSAGSGLSGTSNATSMTITGMPAAIRPTRTQIVQFPGVGDNSALIGDGEQILAQIDTAGVITFLINGSSTAFTASGTKGTGLGGTITYLTN